MWGAVKNKVAAQPDMNATTLTLRNRLLSYFAAVTKRQLISLWRQSIVHGRHYLAMDAQDENTVET